MRNDAGLIIPTRQSSSVPEEPADARGRCGETAGFAGLDMAASTVMRYARRR